MVQFIELTLSQTTPKKILLNCNRIQEIRDRPGYGRPMVTVTVDMGLEGHYYHGTSTKFADLICYAVYDDLVEKLTNYSKPVREY